MQEHSKSSTKYWRWQTMVYIIPLSFPHNFISNYLQYVFSCFVMLDTNLNLLSFLNHVPHARARENAYLLDIITKAHESSSIKLSSGMSILPTDLHDTIPMKCVRIVFLWSPQTLCSVLPLQATKLEIKWIENERNQYSNVTLINM